MNEIALCYLSLPSEVNMYLEGDKKKKAYVAMSLSNV